MAFKKKEKFDVRLIDPMHRVGLKVTWWGPFVSPCLFLRQTGCLPAVKGTSFPMHPFITSSATFLVESVRIAIEET